MACFHPLTAYQTVTGEVHFAARSGMDLARELSLPCGQCIGCRLERSRQWAVRCYHESQMYDYSSFVTLTYNDDNCPISLDYRHFQLFMKRLIKRRGSTRFFMAGEYGDEFGRPHFHACLFGQFFTDRKRWSQLPSGSWLYVSEELDNIWGLGHTSVGDVTFDSAAYVARYICKKVTGPDANWHYSVADSSTGECFTREPEFCHMSLKPGIGAKWYAKYRSEVFPLDRVVVRGAEMRPPKYYSRLLDRQGSDPDFVGPLPVAELDSRKEVDIQIDEIEFARYERALMYASENTERRLADREAVTKAKVGLLKRVLK